MDHLLKHRILVYVSQRFLEDLSLCIAIEQDGHGVKLFVTSVSELQLVSSWWKSKLVGFQETSYKVDFPKT